MWSKIYFIALGVSLVLVSFFTFYSYSWLGSIGNPKDAAEGFMHYLQLAGAALWIFTFILLILANILLWMTRRGWALWTSFGFFSFFTLLRYLWLENAFLGFQKVKFLSDSGFSFRPFIGVMLVICAGVIIFLNHYLNLRLNTKMYPPPETEKDLETVEEE